MSSTIRRSSGIAMTAAIGMCLVTTLVPAAMSTAAARPPTRPGTVGNLTLSATKPDAAYSIDADWAAASNATSYRVVMTNTVGTVLDHGSVTDTSYTGAVTQAANTTVKVSVTAYNGRRHGKSTTKSLVLADLTAPSASYALTPADSSDGNVTIQQTSLTDDVSASAAISQHVEWGDGTSTDVAGTVTSIPHGFGSTKAVYYPVVTVTDLAGNQSSYPLTAVVADVTAPSGAFSVSPASAWASWTRVTVSQSALSDDLSAADKITRVVAWGDGSEDAWTGGTTLTHVYSAAGSHSPTVTIADEAGNTSIVATSAVDVAIDAVAPSTRLLSPAYKRTSVRSWATLHGRATDSGTGVRNVRVRAIEKRGSVWYSYRPASKTWVRAGKTAAAAWHKARAARVSTDAAHLWTLRLSHLTRGVLVAKVSAIDNVANASPWKARTVKLTRR
jgi:hypothetical protein